jgi:hypothetical protein
MDFFRLFLWVFIRFVFSDLIDFILNQISSQYCLNNWFPVNCNLLETKNFVYLWIIIKHLFALFSSLFILSWESHFVGSRDVREVDWSESFQWVVFLSGWKFWEVSPSRILIDWLLIKPECKVGQFYWFFLW